MFYNLKSIALFGLLLFTITIPRAENNSKPVSFSFMIKNDKFWPQYSSNATHLVRLGDQIKGSLSQIQNGQIIVNIISYCNSFDSREKNAELSRTRAENFKKALIEKYGLKESQITVTPFSRSSSDLLLATLTYRKGQPTTPTQDHKMVDPPLTLAPTGNAGSPNDTLQIITYGLVNDSVVREVNFIDTPSNIPPIDLAPVAAHVQAADTVKRATVTRAGNQISPPQHYLQFKSAKNKRAKQKQK